MPEKADSGLSDIQERFCLEYLKDFNQTAAYRRAGYRAKSDSVASTGSSQLMRNPKIQAFLKELLTRQQERLELTADRILEEYKYIGLSDITDVVSFDSEKVELKDSKKLPKRVTRAIKQISIQSMTIPNPRKGGDPIEKTICTVTMHDKLKALDKLSERFGVLERPEEQKKPTDTIELELVTKKPEDES